MFGWLEQCSEGVEVCERFRPLRFRRRLGGLLGCRAVSVEANDPCAVLLTLCAGRLRLCVTGSVPLLVAVRAGRLRHRVTGSVTAE